MGSSNDFQHFLHDRKLCIGCKDKDEDTIKGHWYCRACSDRRNAIIRERRDPEKDKAVRADRRAKGICTRCGQRPADEGFVTCTKCREYHRNVLNTYLKRKEGKRMKKYISLILALALIITMTGFAARPWTDRQTTAHQIAELARSMGLPEDDPIIVRASEIWWEDEPSEESAETDREQSVDLYAGVLPYEIAYDEETDWLAVMLAKTMYNEARGIYSLTELSMICWTVLNRVDAGMYADVYSALMAPWQFAYGPYAPTVSDYGYDLVALARDVLYRWKLEHEGQTDVGRVLPAGYCWYSGDGRHNYFRASYNGQGAIWFGLVSPYES